MTFKLPALPYSLDALSPHMSKETLEFHHGKHHAKYVDTLNQKISGTPFEKKSLEEIIRESDGPIFNNAAQTWNHTFFWNCLSPEGGGAPEGVLANSLNKAFQSFEKFKEDFTNQATVLFGAGWTWLVKKQDGTLAIVNLPNAGCPLKDGQTPLMTLDVWEHAYYIDYRNLRPKFIEAFWNLVNWDFVESQLQGTKKAVEVPVGN